MLRAMAQSKRNFCRRNCKLWEKGRCSVGVSPAWGRRLPRNGGAYFVGWLECERGEKLEERRW